MPSRSSFPTFLPSAIPSDSPTTAFIWEQLGQDIVGAAAGDYFGSSLSISQDGMTVAIAANGNDSNGSNSGHVRVFQFIAESETWVQLGGDINGERAGDGFGSSVSLSQDGTIVAIGATGNDNNGSSAGHVRIFQLNVGGNAWIQLGNSINGESTGDYSGSSVSLSQDGLRVAIGAYGNDGNGASTGHVRVLELNRSTNMWVQLGGDIEGEAVGDESGRSVSLSQDGTIVAIGAATNDGNGSSAGHVRVFQYSENSNLWTQLGEDIDGEMSYDGSGRSVSLSQDGMRVAVGASGNDGHGSSAGHARVFEFNEESNAWVQLEEEIDSEAASDNTGWCV